MLCVVCSVLCVYSVLCVVCSVLCVVCCVCVVCCECCVLSGRGYSDGLVARPEESYRL